MFAHEFFRNALLAGTSSHSRAALEAAIQKLSRRLPMRVAEHEIVLHGACQTCAAS